MQEKSQKKKKNIREEGRRVKEFRVKIKSTVWETFKIKLHHTFNRLFYLKITETAFSMNKKLCISNTPFEHRNVFF